MTGWKRAAALLAVAALAAATSAQAAPKVGQPAPDFTATTFGGREVKLADLKGDVIVLNFWATWCGPCRRELPLLERVFEAYSQYGFQVLAVATEDSVSERELRPIAAQLKIPFVKRLRGPYRVLDGVPTSYVIDRSGKLVYAKAEAFDLDAINDLVVPLLKQPYPDATDAATAPTTAAATSPAAASAGKPPTS